MTNALFTAKAASGAAEFNPWDAQILPNYTTQYDKFGLQSSWYDIVQLCNFFYERDGMIRTIIDKQVEIAINEIILVPNSLEKVSDRNIDLFRYVANSLAGFFAQAATEYFISGLVVPEIVWGTVSKDESGLSKDFSIPIDLWVRNPMQIELKPTPLPNKVMVLWKVPDDTVSFIQNKGKNSDGTEDKETYDILRKDFPDFVRTVEKGETSIPLPTARVIRRKPMLRTIYPAPYLMPALESLMHKRNLRKMDYAVAGRVINAILHFRIGSDDFPVSVDDYGVIDELEAEIRRRGTVNNQERVFELFTNHTVDIKWITPDVQALLNNNKYDQINQEILYALGFPKFLITGEKDKSNSGSSKSALLSPLNTIETMRRDFQDLLNYIFRQIALRNNIKQAPLASFAPLRLLEMDELISLSQEFYNQGLVSANSLLDLAGFDLAVEQGLRAEEQFLYKIGAPNAGQNNNDQQQTDSLSQGEGSGV